MDKSAYLRQNITTSISKDQLWEMFLNGEVKMITKNNVKAILDGSEQEEFLKCKEDIVYFAEKHFHIVDLDKGEQLIKLYDWQKVELINWRHNSRSNTCQSRQIGGTTLQALFTLHQALFFDSYNIAILFSRESMAKEFLNRLKMALDKIPNFLKQGVLSFTRDSILFPNSSQIFCRVFWVDALHSQSVNTLIFDNPDYMDSDIFDKFFKCYIPVMSSMLKSKIIMCGTPSSTSQKHSRQLSFSTRGYNTNFYPWYVLPHHTTDKWKNRMLRLINNDTDRWDQEFELKYEV